MNEDVKKLMEQVGALPPLKEPTGKVIARLELDELDMRLIQMALLVLITKGMKEIDIPGAEEAMIQALVLLDKVTGAMKP